MERRLTADEPISEWLHALASTGANPGGGAAAALMAGMAAALVEMVVAHRRSHASPEEEIRRRCLEAFSAAMRETAPEMADQDTVASSGFAAANRRDDAADRSAAMREAGLAAAESSVSVGRFAATLVPVLRELVDDTSTLLLADVGTAAATLAASTRAAALNVGTDLRIAGDAGSERSDLLRALDELETTTGELEAIVDRVRDRVTPRGA
ncbi:MULTISPECIES: cyclodeaminase/cyclohydrolase family protein [unclassified Agromyces]|uniref:cyclodeaminase/cyclohydrolase family protein n=1 Tax=unclassified Agromyces TaxID=2639701 RepID=UPI003014551F